MLTPRTPVIELPVAPLEGIRQSSGTYADESPTSFRELLNAAFRQSNTVGSAMSRKAEAPYTQQIDETFNPWESVKGTKYEEHWERFADEAFNQSAADSLKQQIDMEEQDRRTIAAAGPVGFLANMGAAVIDLPSLLPAGALYKVGKVGVAAGRSALSVGAASVAASGAAEIALQSTQELRTPEESAFAIGGSAVLGALGGASLSRVLSAVERRALAQRIDKELNLKREPDAQAENEAAVEQSISEARSAGAAAAPTPTLEGLSIAGKAAGGVGKASAWMRLNPLVRLLDSPSPLARSVATRMMENPIYLKQNLEGVASEAAVETLVKEYAQGSVAQAMTEMDGFYRAMRQRGVAIPKNEFKEAVGRAMRRNDEDQIPEVAAAAKAWRKTVFDPLKQRAIDAGLLPKDVDVKTADSYFSRLWNWRMIEASEGDFKTIVKNWVDRTIKAEVGRLTQNKTRRINSIQGEIADLGLSAEDRARLLTTFPAELKALREGRPDLVALDQQLSDLRSQEFAAREAGKAGDAEALHTQVAETVKAAGDDYAQYVEKRNLLSTRVRRIRNNIVGRENQVEQLRARIADAEAANVDRLWRLHRSLTLLEQRMERASPEEWAGELAKARTDFAKVLERSNKAQDRLQTAKTKAQEEAASAAPEQATKIDEAFESKGQEWELRELDHLDEMNEVSNRIGELESIDPEEAVRQLQMAVQKRIDQAADVVEQSTKRMVALVEKLKKSDPEITKARVAALTQRIADLERKFSDRVDIGLDAQNNYEGYKSEIVDSIYNQLTGRIDGDVPRDIVPTARGPLKERTFNIPDKLVEPFLESDIELVGRRYARIMAAEVELARKFGSPDMRDALKSIQDEYAKLRVGKSGKELEHLNKKEKADLRDLRAVRDMLRGTYLARENASGGARALAVVNLYNYVRSMGGVVASSLTDVARPIMVHGLGRFMGQGIAPLVSNLKAVKLSVKEARIAGAVTERILNTRMATWAEIADPYSSRSPFEAFMENTAKKFSQANGMVYWNDFMKSFASVMTQNRILEGVQKVGKLGKNEKAYLAFLGIDDTMAERVAAQFAKHGDDDGGVLIANTLDWDDIGARTAYRAALNKDVDSIIVTKGVGDVPLFAHTPLGRAALQFKSFALASHQRAFMRGLQGVELGLDGGRAGNIAGMMTATTVGMFIYWLKSVESNRTADLSDNPGRWIAEGLDRSGMFAIPFEINNTMEKALGIGAYGGLASAFPGRDQSGKASRYISRSAIAGVMGPTGDFVDTLVKVANGVKDGDMKESDVNAIRRLAPFGTLPVVRSLLEYGVMPRAREAVAD